jgi:hypothetical protein
VSDGLADAVIRGVVHRRQLIRSIRTVRAIWWGRECRADGAGSSIREVFLLKGDKQRADWVFERPAKCGKGEAVPHGHPRAPTAKPGRKGTTGEGTAPITAGVAPARTRQIEVYDGRTAWALLPTETGPRRGPRQVACEPWGITPSVAAWAGIESRFGASQHGPSSIVRGDQVTAERVPGPPERYRVTAVKATPQPKKSVWWVAPEYGYAVTRVEIEYSGLHPRRYTYEYGDFKELAPGLWLPHRARNWAYASSAPGKWRATSYSSAAAQSMKLNIGIPDDYFRLPGAK